jgi:hypothetical protein
MQDAWRGLVAEPAKAVLATAQDNAQEALDDVTASIRARALADGACGVCERPLDAPAIARLRESVATVTADPAEVLSNVASTLEQATTLGRFANADRSAEIERLWKQLERASVEQTSARDRIKDINELLSDANPDEIRKSRTQYDKVIAQIHDHEVAIEKTEEEINTLDGRIVDLKKQIQEAGDEGEATSSANARAETLRAAADVFDGAIERYKEELRGRVEADASRFFLEMTTEPTDYTGLQINDSYGLQIVHTDGQIEFDRSAGQEHVVALALMAALQRKRRLEDQSSWTRLSAVWTNSTHPRSLARFPTWRSKLYCWFIGRKSTRTPCARPLVLSWSARIGSIASVHGTRTSLTLEPRNGSRHLADWFDCSRTRPFNTADRPKVVLRRPGCSEVLHGLRNPCKGAGGYDGGHDNRVDCEPL